MPHKDNAARRHHIPRPKRRVTNWAVYNAALRRRGSLTVWFTEEAIASWRAAPRTTPGGQPHYSDLAITTALMLRAVFHLAAAPDRGADRLHPPVARPRSAGAGSLDHRRRAQTGHAARYSPTPPAALLHLLVDSSGLKLGGPGEWLVEKHGTNEAALLAGPAYWLWMPTPAGSSRPR